MNNSSIRQLADKFQINKGFIQHYFLKKAGAGFTLIELVVVMAIIAILAAAGLSSFATSQAKGRDGRRKADLTQVSRALEMCYNDHKQYPLSNNGLIVSCGASYDQVCQWGNDAFKDNKETVYMIKLPKDPSSTRKYYYYSEGPTYYLYAWLESTPETPQTPAVDGTNCDAGSGSHVCTFGISSSNKLPYKTL